MTSSDFSLPELALYLHVSPQQVERLVQRELLPGRRVGGEWRFSRADVHHWMEQRMGLLAEEELERVERRLHRGDSDGVVGSLARMLPREAVAVPLQARTKYSAFTEIVEVAARTGLLWDAERMMEAVRQREELHSTALENGVALLHPRRPLAAILAEPFLALGTTSQGIPFGGGRMLTDVFFLICSTNDRGHLQTLARLSRLLSQSDFLTALRSATDAATAYDVVVSAEARIDGDL
ncbi:MAG TPA: PTS sugar transporter subunit IIA [Pirellulaceae bacterium]